MGWDSYRGLLHPRLDERPTLCSSGVCRRDTQGRVALELIEELSETLVCDADVRDLNVAIDVSLLFGPIMSDFEVKAIVPRSAKQRLPVLKGLGEPDDIDLLSFDRTFTLDGKVVRLNKSLGLIQVLVWIALSYCLVVKWVLSHDAPTCSIVNGTNKILPGLAVQTCLTYNTRPRYDGGVSNVIEDTTQITFDFHLRTPR